SAFGFWKQICKSVYLKERTGLMSKRIAAVFCVALLFAILPATVSCSNRRRPTVTTTEADRMAPVPEAPLPVPVTPVERLPDTASPLPLVALAGVFSLGVARLLKGRC